jgi:hypothetical protein
MKAVPANKKKSLGKLPTEVRNKMGFMKKGGSVKKKATKKKAFKPHNMYNPKTGKAVKAPTMAKHLELKKKGYGHTKPKKKTVKKRK